MTSFGAPLIWLALLAVCSMDLSHGRPSLLPGFFATTTRHLKQSTLWHQWIDLQKSSTTTRYCGAVSFRIIQSYCAGDRFLDSFPFLHQITINHPTSPHTQHYLIHPFICQFISDVSSLFDVCQRSQQILQNKFRSIVDCQMQTWSSGVWCR